MGGCNQVAAAYSSLYFSFFFLSNFQTLKFFVTLFSGTVRPRRLKLGIHVDSGQMYHVYQNQAAAAYWSCYFFSFLSLQFSNIEFFHHTFLRNLRPRRLKLSTHVDSGQMYCVYQNQAAAAYSSLWPFISSVFFVQFSNIKIFRHTFLRNCEALKVETWYIRGHWQMYHVYWNQAAASYLSFISSFFFVFNFQILKLFVAFFSETVRPTLGQWVDVSCRPRSGCCFLFAPYFSLQC